MSLPAMTSRRYSGRVGGLGLGIRATGARSSAMVKRLLFLDAIRKQNVMDAVRQFAPGGWVGGVASVAVEFALDLTWMRRHQEDTIADEDGFGDRVRHEQHRESRLLPQLQEFFLHLAARKGI